MTTPRARRVAPLAALVVSVLTLTACVDGRDPDAVPTAAPPATSTSPGSPDAAPPAGVVVPVGAPTVVASGLTTPWSVAFLDGTALISQRDTGEILEIVGSRTRVVGTVPDLAAGGEGGLLGIAVRGERLYAYVTTADGNRVVRFDVRGAPGGYALGEAETVIDGIPSANIHNGGRIAFGPDGLLYITTGEPHDPRRRATPTRSRGRSCASRPTATCRPTTPSPVLRCGAGGTATPRASGGMPRARCSPRSSGRTPGTS